MAATATWDPSDLTKGDFVTYDGFGFGQDAYLELKAVIAETQEGTSLVGKEAELSLVSQSSVGKEGKNLTGEEANVTTASETSVGQEGTNLTGEESNLVLKNETSEGQEGKNLTGEESKLILTTEIGTLGIETPILSFSEDRKQATAVQGAGTSPTTYEHTASYSGSDMLLTTSVA